MGIRAGMYRVALMGNERCILLTIVTAGAVVSALWLLFWVQPRGAYLLAISDCSVGVQTRLEARGHTDANRAAWATCEKRVQRRLRP